MQPSMIVPVKLANGQTVPWDLANDPNPVYEGNNKSREAGFLWNCYKNPMGRFFQETIKNSIVRAIEIVHGKKGILRYDRQAYVYDDARLKLLEQEISLLIEKYVVDPVLPARERKRAMLNQIKDIALFVAGKEDIYYRSHGIPLLLEFAHFMVDNEQVFQLTEAERIRLEKDGVTP
jgi:hypothetical protein